MMLLSPLRHLDRQAARFCIAGAFVTTLTAAAYGVFALALGVPPLAASVIAYVIAVLVGFHIHARWTFEENRISVRDQAARVRFVVASVMPLLLNLLWVSLLTDVLGGPSWLPLLPMVIITPVATYLTNRCWVFAAQRG